MKQRTLKSESVELAAGRLGALFCCTTDSDRPSNLLILNSNRSRLAAFFNLELDRVGMQLNV
jgi:hypothetical protein